MALALPGLLPSQEKPANPTAKLQPPCVEPVSAYPQLPILVQEETLLLDAMCQLWGENKSTKNQNQVLLNFQSLSPLLSLQPWLQQSPHGQDFGIQTQKWWGLTWK